MLEKGQLYFLTKDGTKDSVCLNVKHKRILFGSSEHCTIRIYIDGIFPKHCVLTFENTGKAYLEPLHPSALTLVNGIKIKHKICLEDNDVITVFIKELQFTYLPNSSSINVYIETLSVPNSKQMKPAQRIEISTHEKNWETSKTFRGCKIPIMKYNPKKLICMIKSDIFRKIPEFLLKLALYESVNISSKDMNSQNSDSYFVKPLMKHKNPYIEESFESRKNLVLKLYEFFSFIRDLLNKKEDNIFDLLPILESVSKYSIARASNDILFLPLKSLYLSREEKNFHMKTLQSKKISYYPKNVSPNSETMLEKKNICIQQKQNQHSSQNSSISYKKRVSLAVKRYYLRKRKTIIMPKYDEIEKCENTQISDGRQCMKADSDEWNAIANLEEYKTTRTKRKQIYNRKVREELKGKRETKKKQEGSMKIVENTTEKENIGLEPTKEKPRNKKAAKKTQLSTSTQECNTKNLPNCQRITRSMAKNRS